MGESLGQVCFQSGEETTAGQDRGKEKRRYMMEEVMRN